MGLPSALKMREFTVTLLLAYLSKTWNHPFECGWVLASPFLPSRQISDCHCKFAFMYCDNNQKEPPTIWLTHLFRIDGIFLGTFCGVSHQEMFLAAGWHISLMYMLQSNVVVVVVLSQSWFLWSLSCYFDCCGHSRGNTCQSILTSRDVCIHQTKNPSGCHFGESR